MQHEVTNQCYFSSVMLERLATVTALLRSLHSTHSTQHCHYDTNLLKASAIMVPAADNVTLLIQKIFRLNTAATELTLETLRVKQFLTEMGNAGIKYLFPQYI